MSAVQRMKVANERHSKTITQRGHVQKTTVAARPHVTSAFLFISLLLHVPL
uniref:Stress-associated endoplasmic reticulum protein n=1 Tax=Denticeps clupeoides TaxID=299321 RepID=A0AAY4BQ72_9TELE